MHRAEVAETAPWRRVASALREHRVGSDGPVCAYVYDMSAVRAQATRLRRALPSWCEIFYAVKANADPAVLREMATLIDGFEVASLGELTRAREAAGAAGRPNPRTVFSGPAKTDRDLEEALRAGVELVNVESSTELHRLQWVAERAGVRAPAALRVNPRSVPLSGSHTMGGVASQFGIEEAALSDAVALARRLPALDLRGLHFHAVSNNLDAAAHARFVERCLAAAGEVEAREVVALPVVDVGGGLGVSYDGDGGDLRVEELGTRLAELDPGRRVLLEPGRFLVAGCGYYAAEVVDVKHNHGRHFAVVRGGVHHFRLPSTPFAGEHGHPFAVLSVEDWPYPFRRPQVVDAQVSVAGELCTPRDLLARDTWVQRLRAGDIVVLPLAGAYGWEISHHDFLAHPYPHRIVLD